MTKPTAARGRRGLHTLLALAAALAGAVTIGVAVAGQQRAAEAPSGASSTSTPAADGRATPETRPDATPSASPGDHESAAEQQAVTTSSEDDPLPASEPVSLRIPAIDVRTEVFPIGKAADGTLKAPQPGPNLDKAAWYKHSPTPGQPGPSVIEGHVDTAHGPSVFFDLGDLRPGDKIRIEREDGRVVTFTVDRLREFPKDEFPTMLVYGSNLDEPTLRLITCSAFDPGTGHHTGNLIVFAHLTNVEPPPS